MCCLGNDQSHVGEASATEERIKHPTFDRKKLEDCCNVSHVLQKFVDKESTMDDKLAFWVVPFCSEADIATIVLLHGGNFQKDSIETSME